ncbi:hypothetical protein K8354_16240 [Polaribacter litorisediminis]|uniref:hypothetical protein n=1 Tax=Polaribacter litorisediminis TaxID=1908341 RepID=UPI001CBCAC93|nr:hypothetical protein [Polaribacter litorisediminis]UAM97808.1 hypothetical protein K8354_16180 [Polaribacter litorisediminis]UAM97820.1 hypothetical protein K8354_16240 [Polaribacter litorisediminis]
MEEEIRKKRNILKGIGILEIIGGITGIGLIVWFLLQGFQMNSYSVIIFLITILFYSYSIFAGIILFKKTEKGISHSWIIQFIQIIGISFNGITYMFTSGGNFMLGYNWTENNLTFNLGIASEFDLSISQDINNFIQINLIAIVIIYILDKTLKSISEKNELLNNYFEKIDL